MLCLSREKDQYIQIGEHITVKVLEFRADRVLLGIEAPRDVPILRAEIAEAVKRSKPTEAP